MVLMKKSAKVSYVLDFWIELVLKNCTRKQKSIASHGNDAYTYLLANLFIN